MRRPVPTEDLAAVLAPLVGFSWDADRVCRESGLSWERTRGALDCLRRRGVVRHSGGGHYDARQESCAGSCMRRGRDLRGGPVCVDAETLRWFCEPCWQAETALVASIVA